MASQHNVTLLCKKCGKEFIAKKIQSGRVRLFCSPTCANSRTKSGELKQFTCKHCGKEFSRYVIPSQASHHTNEFCSQTCHNRHRRTKPDEFYSHVPKRKVKYLKQIPCPVCGKIFKPSQSSIKTCSRDCGNAIRNSNKGKMRTPHSVIDTIKNLYPIKTAKQISPIVGKSVAAIHFIAGKIGARLTREQILEKEKQAGLVRRGKNNTLWLGGTKNLPWGKDWNRQRNLARERDNFTCQVCKKPAKTVHHVTPRRMFVNDIDKSNDLSNLITLCAHCHRLVETGKIPCPRKLSI